MWLRVPSRGFKSPQAQLLPSQIVLRTMASALDRLDVHLVILPKLALPVPGSSPPRSRGLPGV